VPQTASADTVPTAVATLPHVVVLGAGPAGVGAAYRLRRRGQARVTVLEARDTVGGNAGSFELDGIYCDFGSHRLHPVVAPDIMEDLRQLLGDDLMLRVRHGRILLRGRWIHFPLKPVDLLLRLPKGFAFGVLGDLFGKVFRKLLRRAPSGEHNFATVLERGLGRTMCREFYFPYAKKLWGLPPEELAVTTAQRRVSGSSIGKIFRKILGQVPGLRKPLAGRFYYPRGGYGRISQCLHEAARKEGADFLFNARVRGIDRTGQRVTGVRYERDGREHVLPADMVWSTVPVTMLVRGMKPEPPPDVMEAATAMKFRGMILIYLVLQTDQFSPTDAYYFPEEAVPISRMSEPKNFTGSTEPRGRTVLCAELPSDPGQPEWDLDDAELGRRLCSWIEKAGLPVRVPIEKVVVHRLRQAYPVYSRGYDKHFGKVDEWLGRLDGFLTLGRQGLFAHDNTHHTLAMAYAAADCLLRDGSFNRANWAEHRREFETHVVED
jgi:protoporphyrinogen oxidase